MPSLGQFDYTLSIANGPALQALQAIERQAAQTRAAVQGQSSQFTLKTDQATAALGNLTKAAMAAAAAIQKPITPQVNTKPAESQLQKFGQQFASGLGFGSGAAIAVAGVNAISDALKEAVVGGIQYNAQLETATATLELFTGSSSKAQGALQTLRQYADFTPFDTDEVIQGGQAFIKAVDGDTAAMERLIHLSGQLAATNPDVASGGGFKSATVALREVLGGQTESIAERFNIPRSTIQSLKDAGLSGEALAAALVKAAHGSEDLVEKLSTTGAGRLSNLTSEIKNLEQELTKPLYEQLNKQVAAANENLSVNKEAYHSAAQAAGSYFGAIIEGAPLAFSESTFGKMVKGTGDVLNFAAAIGKLDEAQRNAAAAAGHEEPGGGPFGFLRPAAPSRPLVPSDREDRNAAGATIAVAKQTAAQLEAEAKKLGADLKELNDDTTRHAIQSLDDQVKAAHDAAAAQKKAYDDTRDAAVAAADQTRDARIRALDAEHQAFQDANASAIRGLEVRRDAQLSSADSGHQAVIRGLEAEAQARERARTQEDRERDASQQSILRGLETVHDANQRGFDAEQRAVEQKRDAALRALDEESRAEAVRHRDALQHIDAEKDRKLGVIDKQRDALDKQHDQEIRHDTDRSLSQALSAAKGQLKNAKTKAEKESAQRAVNSAEIAIDKEHSNRKYQDAKQALADQADLIRKQAEARKSTEGDLNQANTQTIAVEKASVADQAKLDILAIGDRSKAEKDAYDKEVQDRKDSYKADNEALADRRKDEDADLALRKQGADDFYAAQQKAIRATFDDPETGSIPALHRQAEAADREYAHQKQVAGDAYDAAKKAADETYKAATSALEANTNATVVELDRQKRLWTEWKEFVQGEIAAAIKAGNPAALRNLQVVPPSLQNGGQGTGEAPSHDNIPSLANLKQEYGPTSAEIGAAIAAGVSEGLAGEDAQAQIKGATDTAIQTNVIDEAKSLLGVQSPSTVFRQIGADTVAGFQDGYQSVPLAPIIRAPFEEARDWLTPYWVGTMTDAGVAANVNFVAGYDGPGVNLGIMSPFNQFFDTDSAYLIEGFKNVGISTGKSLGDGFISANPGDRIFAEVRGAAVDLTRLYPTFVQLGANFATSLANGFDARLAEWHAMQAQSSGLDLGSQVGGYATGGSPPVGRASLMGEHGPELFVPREVGQVIPADTTANLLAAANGSSGGVGGGAVNINQTFNIESGGPDMEAWAHRVATISIEGTITALDQAHRNQPTRVSRIQSGAD